VFINVGGGFFSNYATLNLTELYAWLMSDDDRASQQLSHSTGRKKMTLKRQIPKKDGLIQSSNSISFILFPPFLSFLFIFAPTSFIFRSSLQFLFRGTASFISWQSQNAGAQLFKLSPQLDDSCNNCFRFLNENVS
jgi:hypothetical protein